MHALECISLVKCQSDNVYWVASKPSMVPSNECRKATSHLCCTVVRLNTHSLMEKWVFLHLFHDCSKSNIFSENLIKTKFILHKISFRMSIFSSSETLANVLQFTFKNNAPRFSVYNNYYCHETGRSFEPIFMKFTRLVRVLTQVNLFLKTIGPIEPLIWGRCSPQLVFWLSKKKLSNCIRYPIFHRKR